MSTKVPATEFETVVLDAGGRYGIHPTWQGFEGLLRYVMFEPDQQEAARLAAKYSQREHIKVVAEALGEQRGRLTMNVLRHHGQSTALKPNEEATWFSRTRKGEGDVVGQYEAPVNTVDLYCKENGLAADFLKIDTEGSELTILKGAAKQLQDNVLGLRCEVSFDEVYIGGPRFSDISNLLYPAGFVLLNLDYTGAGASFGPFFDGPRFGILSGGDSVWIRSPKRILETANAEAVLKYAAFCMRNHATDLALHVLESAAKDSRIGLSRLAGTRLMHGLDVAVQRLFYRLSHKPRYDFEFLDAVYFTIFARHLKPMHEFFESDEVNP